MSSPATPPPASATRTIALPPGEAKDPKVLLVGVAHVLDLEKGLDRVLGDYRPSALAVELDPERAEALTERARERDAGGPGERPSSKGAPIMLRLWARFQDRLASDMGGIPGEEMLQVGAFAKRRSLPCFLVDDPIRTIAPRLLSALTPKERVRLLVSTVIAMVIPTRLVEKEIASYSEHRDEYLEVMRTQLPTVTRVLLDERNQHMAERLVALARSYGRVAAVVGDAHVTGLGSAIGQSGVEVEQVHLERLQPPPTAPAA